MMEISQDDQALVAAGFLVVREGVTATYFVEPAQKTSTRRKRLWKKGEVASFLDGQHRAGRLLGILPEMFSFTKRKRPGKQRCCLIEIGSKIYKFSWDFWSSFRCRL